MSERLNADVAIASANQVSLRLGDARVALKDILHFDSDKSVRACCRDITAPLCSLTISGMLGTSAPPSTLTAE